MKGNLAFGCALVFLLLGTLLSQGFASPESPNLTELQSGWRMTSARNVSGDDALVSQPTYDASGWYSVQRMPATVLQILEDNGVYKNLYYSMNLATPEELWKQDWWYRTTFTAPAGQEVYSLIFKGINYRADIWLNGHRVASRWQAVGMYNEFEFDVTEFVVAGGSNVLAVKVTPEQGLTERIELGDSWLDWINWKYIGYHDAEKHLDIPFVPDRNAGVWKRVYLSSTGAVTIRNAYVATALPLPATSPASLTVYCDLSNSTSKPVSGTLYGEISRPGKPSVKFERSVSLVRNQTQEVTLTPADYPQLSVTNPDLWWPYRWGEPNLYHLELRFEANHKISDSQAIDFGIRQITPRRDSDSSFPEIGGGGNFYLQINGRDYLIRGGVYSPDLLFKNDPERDAATMRYVKDLGLNLIRWELKIADDSMIERADREGVPVMLGWMCCAQWEHWELWSAEDQWVARASLRARIRELRSHPSVVIWANGSDGLPPDPVLSDYRQILRELHWQNAAVDTVSNYNRSWNGIHMVGPYVWRPPYYWFSDKYGPARGSSAEEGDNETIPPLESLKKFIPPDKLWPINESWYFHAGANEGNSTLENIQRVLDKRYGPSSSAEEFSRKAQLAHYEDVRAQYETYATHWDNRKMTVHWMMNNPWPSLFGHLFDYYFKQGGGYFGAKKALRRVGVVWDYYATGDRNTAKVYVANQTLEPLNHLRVSLASYSLDGGRKYFNEVKDFSIGPSTSAEAMTVGRIANVGPVYLVRCELRDANNKLLADNVYWESITRDDLGEPKNDEQFKTNLVKWADLSALNTMPPAEVKVSGNFSQANGEETATIVLTNNSSHVAFFLRAEVTNGVDGEEVLPVTYDDNYVTVFPHEMRTIVAKFTVPARASWSPAIRLEGYNVGKKVLPLKELRTAGSTN
ncbi:MAG: beta galactosidase jelly roll domain-containing protein [Acidobacteriia bacterium]|nr:beta galactosidase jelly roll domain-containing protein [Terriglobia bacterium]